MITENLTLEEKDSFKNLISEEQLNHINKSYSLGFNRAIIMVIRYAAKDKNINSERFISYLNDIFKEEKFLIK